MGSSLLDVLCGQHDTYPGIPAPEAVDSGRRGMIVEAIEEGVHTMSPMSIPSPPPEWAQFPLGPLTIHTYALCLIAGMVAATIYTQRRLSDRGEENGVVLDIVLWAIPLGIVGARFYHVLTHGEDYFYPGANLWDVFAIWDGGNALYGSLIGGAVGAYIGCRRTGIRLWSFADALAPAMLVAQAIGRLGNYFNHELFGLPTTLPWGWRSCRQTRCSPRTSRPERCFTLCSCTRSSGTCSVSRSSFFSSDASTSAGGAPWAST
jgi:hypothetical protein